jgi:hypothetical protein
MLAASVEAYVARKIDDEVVTAICQWNATPGHAHTYWLHLPYEPDTGCHFLLKRLAAQLPKKGFSLLLVNAKDPLSPEIPGPLAWTLNEALGRHWFWRVRRALWDVAALPIHAKTIRILAVAVIAFLAVDPELLSKHSGELNRLHWRLLQIFSHAAAMQKTNGPGFFRTVLTMVRVAEGIPIDQECYGTLLKLLEQAEAYFHSEDPSNPKEREAIQLRAIFDANSPESERHLAEIAEEDRLLEQREARLRDAIQQSDWLSAFLALDSDNPLGRSLEELRDLTALLAKRDLEGLHKALAPRIGEIRPERLLPIDLVRFRLWALANSQESRELMMREFGQMADSFIAQHIGAGREESVAALRERFAAWAATLRPPRYSGPGS